MYHEIEVGSFSYSKPEKEINEDCLLLPTYTYNSDIVFAIADGVGSLSGASQASQCAISSIGKLTNQPEFTIENAIKKAKESINELALNNEQLSHSATTLTIVQIGKHKVSIGHIGDCRAYLKKEARLVQLTNDHTRYQEVIDSGEYTPRMLRGHKERLSSVITKALSFQTELDYDLINIPIEECIDGNTILMSLMSDGAYDHWHKRARFADSTMNTPSAFVNSLRKRIEKKPTDDYSCLSVKIKLSNAR